MGLETVSRLADFPACCLLLTVTTFISRNNSLANRIAGWKGLILLLLHGQLCWAET